MNIFCGILLLILCVAFFYEFLDTIFELYNDGSHDRGHRNFLTFGAIFLFVFFVLTGTLGSFYLTKGLKRDTPKVIEYTISSKSLVNPEMVVTTKEGVSDTLYLYKFTEEL